MARDLDVRQVDVLRVALAFGLRALDARRAQVDPAQIVVADAATDQPLPAGGEL